MSRKWKKSNLLVLNGLMLDRLLRSLSAKHSSICFAFPQARVIKGEVMSGSLRGSSSEVHMVLFTWQGFAGIRTIGQKNQEFLLYKLWKGQIYISLEELWPVTKCNKNIAERLDACHKEIHPSLSRFHLLHCKGRKRALGWGMIP